MICKLIGFNGTSTLAGYSMPNPVYTYAICELVGFNWISTLYYLMSIPVYTYILNISDL